MPTAVVSGRVDADLKHRVDAILAEQGTTANEVIGAVWSEIAETRVVPIRISEEEQERLARQRAKFAEFEKWLETLPPPNPDLVNATDEELKEMLVDELMAKYG